MTSAMAPSNLNNEFRALDPELPFLASEAAVDLSNIISGNSEDIGAIRRLADRLRNSIKKSSSGEPSCSLMDPATLTILGGAAAELSSTDVPLRKVDDLLAKTLEIAEFLSSEEMLEKTDKLEQARDFCVALSRAAIAYRQTIRDLRPSHPFRR